MTAHRFAIVVSAATLVLLFAGGLVTTTASGDAVPDWWFVPISFGSLLPPMTGGVLFEHGHRLVASTVGLLTIALALILWRTEDRAWVRRLGWLAVFGVAAQGTLGGLRVHHVGSPAVIAIIHACFAQIFFGTVVTLTVATSRGWREETPVAEPTWLPWIATACCGVVYLQIILGAVRRHTGQWIDVHAAFAALVTLAVLLAAAECLRRGKFQRTATALVSLLFAQILLGLWSYVLVRGGFVRSVNASAVDTVVITGHLALGGLVYALTVALAVRSWRVFRVPAAARTLAGEAAL